MSETKNFSIKQKMLNVLGFLLLVGEMCSHWYVSEYCVPCVDEDVNGLHLLRNLALSLWLCLCVCQREGQQAHCIFRGRNFAVHLFEKSAFLVEVGWD